MAANKKYSFHDFMRGLLVLETQTEITAELEAGIIPNSLKADLAADAPVSVSAAISTIRPNNKYEIANGAKKLLIYKDKEFRSLPTFRVYREDFTLEIDLISGTEIVGTCFYCESELGDIGDPYKRIFPPTMTGVIFKRCNLDNVYVPPGNTITDDAGIQSSHRRIRIQNDLEDWVVDEIGAPKEPLDIKRFEELGKSVDPRDIPASPIEVNP